ncbi:hypothetical protein KHM83_11810 [Fusibacter paucivorans]|uniref:DUF4829 domain-containing protein n=1 Tax=Fusibacter paucivorans TaxID=76009 RepID=A0ABS5PR21_9FIRM|nr:hypothetical protein [Fusibacter paucivorans]MBS7527367.1 hypothetical protein [Fusibacter paucivorans]
MFRKAVMGLILLSVFLTACSRDDMAEQPYDEALTDFLTQSEMGYVGDNHYYHIATAIENQKTHACYTQKISGEILNTDIGKSNEDFTFEMTYEVYSDHINLVTAGNHLNESDYDKIVALQKPLAKDAAWQFKANRDDYHNIKVTATITALSEDQVTVRYEDTKGYEEIRVLTKGKGTTDFYKYYQYQTERVVTGYHEDPSYVTEEGIQVSAFDLIEPIAIDQGLHELIVSYNLAWEQFVKNGDQAIYQYVVPDSPAAAALDSIGSDGIDIDFIAFKPTGIELTDEKCTLMLTEAFFDPEGQMILNDMHYILKKVDEKWLIDSFQHQ